ncbi:MAG TPA: hypothetical protein VNN22_16075 [Verrucomicrobiae bacterium]|nr:hypothetical protein [Verrucomicrobiae bacterium]
MAVPWLRVQEFERERTWMTGSKLNAASGSISGFKRSGTRQRMSGLCVSPAHAIVLVKIMTRRSGV